MNGCILVIWLTDHEYPWCDKAHLAGDLAWLCELLTDLCCQCDDLPVSCLQSLRWRSAESSLLWQCCEVLVPDWSANFLSDLIAFLRSLCGLCWYQDPTPWDPGACLKFATSSPFTPSLDPRVLCLASLPLPVTLSHPYRWYYRAACSSSAC